MTSDERIDDLLVEWEARRVEGNELTAGELCLDAPELLEQVAQKIAVLKDLSWVTNPDELVSDLDGLVDPTATRQQSNVTISEFVRRLSDSGLLNENDMGRVEEYVPSDPQQLAAALAKKLINEKLLTTYQANVILERGDSPLLLDRYVILDSIGAGGMGVVFKALQRSLDRVVAVKVLPKYATDSPEKVERFQREMRAAAKLSHPNVVQAYDAHESNGVYFLAMEYVPGQDLLQLVDSQGPMSASKAIDIVQQAAAGLANAHENGIVHRDVKPSNILLALDGTAKVMDLGLARTRERTQQASIDDLTRDGLAMGTITYMSPEQAFDAKQADEKSDIYSLGCTLYFLLHGRPMFDKSNSVQTVLAHRELATPELGSERTDVSPKLEELFQSMVAKDPGRRPESMTTVHNALANLDALSGAEPSAISGPAFQDSKWWKVPLVGLIAATLGLLFMFARPNGDQVGALAKSAQIQMVTQLLSDDSYSLLVAIGDEEYLLNFVDEIPDTDFEVIGAIIYASEITDDASDDFDIPRLAEFPKLTSLTIVPSPDVEEVSVQSLAGIQFLKLDDLSFNDCRINSLGNIKAFENLESLSFAGCKLQNDLASIVALPRLRDMTISETVGVTDFSWLSQLQNLEYLDLSNSAISTDCIELLGKLPKLQSLHLTGIELIQHNPQIHALSNLQDLSLDATDIDDSNVEQLLQLPHLTYLDVSHTKLSANGLSKLSRKRSLVHLEVAGLPLKAAIGELIGLTNLIVLNVENSDFDDECLEKVSSLTRLSTLYTYGTELSNAAIDRFHRKSPSCEVVQRDSQGDWEILPE